MVTLTRATTESDRRPSSIPHQFDDLSDHAHRQLIGYIGLAMPILLVLIAAARRTEVHGRWELLDSVSAYYYTGSVAVFVGLLVALALFLFTYRGYGNRYHWADRAAAVTAGIAALGVAFFPTRAPKGLASPSWWTETTGTLHVISAVVLFTMFAVFSLWLFRMSSNGGMGDPSKRRRNRVFLVCGIVIVVSMAWALINGRRGVSIFVPESTALVAFAVSWLVKGHAYRTIANAARSIAKDDP